jgi:hypothetical protein
MPSFAGALTAILGSGDMSNQVISVSVSRTEEWASIVYKMGSKTKFTVFRRREPQLGSRAPGLCVEAKLSNHALREVSQKLLSTLGAQPRWKAL